MPFCPNCGTEVTGAFCGKCGAPAAGAASAGGAASPAQGVGYSAQSAPAIAGLADNAAGMLCYLLGLVTGIIFLVLEPYNKKPAIRFHAFQSIFLNVAIIAVWFVVVLGASMMRFMGLFGLIGIFGMLFDLLCFALWIYLLISTYQGKTVVLPVIGPLAQQQSGK